MPTCPAVDPPCPLQLRLIPPFRHVAPSLQAPSPVNPNALDRTAAWLLNMNVQFLEEENAEPECKLRNKDELSQEEKVRRRGPVFGFGAPGPRKREKRSI